MVQGSPPVRPVTGNRHPTAVSVRLTLTAAALGVLAALCVHAFKAATGWLSDGALGRAAPWLAGALGPWATVLVPTLGGLAAGLVVQFWIGSERYHGVTSVLEGMALRGGRLPWQRVPAQVLGASVAIGTGASVGPEDPSVQIGTGLGALLGQTLHISAERRRALVAAGAAAAISSAFAAPIAGVFFAVEILLGEFAGGTLTAALVASVAGSVTTQAIAGATPAFAVPALGLESPWEFPLHAVLGLAAGAVAAAYVTAIHGARTLAARFPARVWIRTAGAGLVVGLVALWLPQVLGVGYGTVEAVLRGAGPAAALLVAILAAKLACTVLCVGAGIPGGVFAPALVLGACLGGAFGEAARAVLPGLPVTPSAYAMSGMAAVLAGAVNAPVTASLLLFEMTGDYRVVLPVLLAVAASQLVARRLQPESVYTVPLAAAGIRLEHGRDVEVLEVVTVGEVMEANPPTLGEDTAMSQALFLLQKTRRHGLPVVSFKGDLVGILTLTDVERSRTTSVGAASVGNACTRDLVVAYPDESLATALRRMAPRELGRLPVVDPRDPKRLVGLLRRSDVIRAYEAALARRRTDASENE